MDIAASDPGTRRIGLQFERSVETAQRLVVSVLAAIFLAEPQKGIRVLRIEDGGFQEVLRRRYVVVFLQIGEAAIEISHFAVVVLLERGRVIGNREIEFAAIEMEIAATDQGVGVDGVEAQGRIEIARSFGVVSLRVIGAAANREGPRVIRFKSDRRVAIPDGGREIVTLD